MEGELTHVETPNSNPCPRSGLEEDPVAPPLDTEKPLLSILHYLQYTRG